VNEGGVPEQEPAQGDIPERDPLGRFRNWRGFLITTIVVNVLFVYGMLAGASDPSVKSWYKALTWLPFNVIATVLYFVFLIKLTRTDQAVVQAAAVGDRSGMRGAFYSVLCLAMIAANWILMFSV
jgi:hypothetical protein